MCQQLLKTLFYFCYQASDEGVFKGQIYAKGDRMDTFIIFDVNGLVAGVQMGVNPNLK